MSLNPRSNYPSIRSYVLKLHRDCRPGGGALRGRLEHIASGRHFEFADATELVLGLVRDLSLIQQEQGESPLDDAEPA